MRRKNSAEKNNDAKGWLEKIAIEASSKSI